MERGVPTSAGAGLLSLKIWLPRTEATATTMSNDRPGLPTVLPSPHTYSPGLFWVDFREKM